MNNTKDFEKYYWNLWFEQIWSSMEKNYYDEIQKKWWLRLGGARKFGSIYDKELARLCFYAGFACGMENNLTPDILDVFKKNNERKGWRG
jgi:hypothetical protein